MDSRFDRRVIPETILGFVRSAQALVPCFPVSPLPPIEPLTSDELRRFRDALAARFKLA